ncbi:MAG: hypothetical protein WB988_07420, partial [Candidatus Nitrosopolaris sp.]
STMYWSSEVDRFQDYEHLYSFAKIVPGTHSINGNTLLRSNKGRQMLDRIMEHFPACCLLVVVLHQSHC